MYIVHMVVCSTQNHLVFSRGHAEKTTDPQLFYNLYSMQRQRYARVLACLMLLAGVLLNAQELQLVYREGIHRVDLVQISSHTYLSLNQIAGTLGLTLERQDDRILVQGPRATLELIEGRPLVRAQQEYVLLSQPVVRRGSRWLVPTDFVENVLPRILDAPLQLLPFGDNGGQEQVSVQVLNSPNRVSLVFLPSRRMLFHVEEFDRALQVRVDRRVEFLQPRVRPESSLVASMDCQTEPESTTCEIVKGFDFRSYRSTQAGDPARLLIDIYSTAMAEVDPVAPNRSTPEQRGGQVITIDPGHGGEERGVTFKGLFEKDLVAQISRHLTMELARRRLVADATRTSDFNPSLQRRSSVANGNRSSVFLSLHVGGSYSAKIRGPVVFTHAGEMAFAEKAGELTPWHQGQTGFAAQSRRLALLIQQRLNGLFGTDNLPATAPLEILAPVQGPAVLVEAGYLTNPADAEVLLQPDFQEAIAISIVDAIEEFLL